MERREASTIEAMAVARETNRPVLFQVLMLTRGKLAPESSWSPTTSWFIAWEICAARVSCGAAAQPQAKRWKPTTPTVWMMSRFETFEARTLWITLRLSSVPALRQEQDLAGGRRENEDGKCHR